VESITDRIVLMARGRVLAAGKVGEIRRLLDDHPLTVRIVAGDRRALATALVALDSVTGIALGAEDDLIVKTLKPDQFFRELALAVRRLESPVSRVEALDASAEAVFGYLVADAGFGGGEGAA
jgi:ABC-2 type transport system ATP-binding protein